MSTTTASQILSAATGSSDGIANGATNSAQFTAMMSAHAF